MTLIDYKIIAALLIFIISITTAIYPLKRKTAHKHSHDESLGTGEALGEALASGIFLGAAFFHMLPEAIRSFAEIYGNTIAYPVPEVICMLGFLLMLFLERLSLFYQSVRASHSIPYILALILIIHALVEGTALGIGATSEAIMIFIAILAHKGSESFALCVTMLRHHLPFKRILFIVIFFSLMTPIGIFLGTAMTIEGKSEVTGALFNAFAAGTFLYISTLHHIHFHKHHKETQGMLEFLCLALGLATMGLIALWV